MATVRNDVYEYFRQEILENANVKIKALEAEIKAIKEKNLALIDEEVHDTVTRVKENELNELNVEYSAAVNRIKVSAHKQIIQRKNELLETIIEEVKQKLLAFVKTDAYKQKMEKQILHVNDLFCEKSLHFKIKKGDKAMKEVVQDRFPKKHKITEVDEILIGGFIAVCEEKGILIDQTIDSSLEEKKIEFYQSSKLTESK